MSLRLLAPLLVFFSLGVVACGAETADSPPSNPGQDASAGGTEAGGGGVGGAGSEAGGAGSGGTGGADAAGAGGAGGDHAAPASSFASSVVSFTPGTNAGYGADEMPEVVLGGPVSTGPDAGSLDVVSLGVGGEIVLAFDQAIIDGEGADFIVFENAFRIGGGEKIFEEPGEVAVSDDGQAWVAFPCDPAAGEHDQCAGIHPVNATDAPGYSATDPSVSGGDPFDLAAIGVERARFVRIRDKSAGGAPPNAGFDLDAVSIVHTAPLPAGTAAP